jgi:hypothetical protein
MTAPPDILSQLPQVRPLLPEQLPALKAAAARENHDVVLPTHVVWQDGEMVGYGGIRPCALLTVWLSAEKVKARESFHLFNLAENLAVNLTHQPLLVVPCEQASPFYPLLRRFGYQQISPAITLNLKAMR